MAKFKSGGKGEPPVRIPTGGTKSSAFGWACLYCKKRCYPSRKAAREANRRLYPTEKMSPYKCLNAPDGVDNSKLWHLGHLADRVIEGRAERGRVYGGGALSTPKPKHPRQPVPGGLRATIENAPEQINDNDNDNDNAVSQQETSLAETSHGVEPLEPSAAQVMREALARIIELETENTQLKKQIAGLKAVLKVVKE